MSRLLTRGGSTVALLVAIVLAATPASSPGASTVSIQDVTLNVMPNVSVFSSGCPATVSFTVSRGATNTSGDCQIGFSTNNPSGVDIRVSDGSDVWALSDGPRQIADLPSAVGPINQDGFGACLQSTNATANWVVSGSCGTSMPEWFGMKQSTPKSALRSTGPVGSGTATFRFAARVSSTQAPTSYTGTVVFEAVANP